MMRITAILLGLLLACTGAFAQSRTCATSNLFHHKHYYNKGKLQASKKQAVQFRVTNCEPEAYYSKVLSKKTDHFQIFYTQEGPHATQKAFVDSVAVNLERAYKHHVNELGLRKPVGSAKTFHYQEKVDDSLYPVEIIDLDLLRRGDSIFDGSICGKCYGLTLPQSEFNTDSTLLIIDNDFRYVNTTGKRKSMDDNPECTYIENSLPLTQQITGEDFSEHWDKAIRITTFHELYHASQLRYLNMFEHMTFWFEASATGVEEFGDPDVNDYFGYINKAFRKIGTPLNEINDESVYGLSTLYLYFYTNVDKKFDKEIWSGFNKNPEKTADIHFANYLSKKKLDADSVFHDYVVRLSFSGERSKAVNSKMLIYKDEKDWPTINYAKTSVFEPDTSRFSFAYYAGGQPNLANYKGEASAVIYSKGKATVIPVKTTNTADSVYGTMSLVDSTVWIFSRLGESDYVETLVKDKKLKAYPTPWREGSLCFSPLPRDKDYIEVRNRRGAIVMQERYQGTMHCIDEKKVREEMSPGVYWFRAGNSGKAEKFIIIY